MSGHDGALGSIFYALNPRRETATVIQDGHFRVRREVVIMMTADGERS
jgi:hypothetical protein